jgi:hypothetical protein
MRAKTITGAAVVCYINGRVLGRVTDFNFSTVTPKRAIYGIDSLAPYELAPQPTKITGSINLVRTLGDGGSEDMVAGYDDISKEKYFSIALVEIGSQITIFQAASCSATSQSWGIPARGSVKGSVSFEALGWTNERQ